MPPTAEGVTAQTAFAPDALYAGSDMPRIKRVVTILTGAAHVRGEVLGKITASGKYIKSLSAAVDGSEVPRVILAEAVDATGGDKLAGVYLTGEFNEAALTLGAAHTADSIREGLRAFCIFLKKVVAA